MRERQARKKELKMSFSAISLIKNLNTRTFFICVDSIFRSWLTKYHAQEWWRKMEWPNSLNQFVFTIINTAECSLAKRPRFDVKYGTNRNWYVNCARKVLTIPERLNWSVILSRHLWFTAYTMYYIPTLFHCIVFYLM